MFALIFIMHFKRLLKMLKFDRDIQMENIPLQNTLNNVQVQANIKCENREGILYNICYNEKHITSIIGLQLKCR